MKDAQVKIISPNEAAFSGIVSGVRLNFCVAVEGDNVGCSLFNGKSELEERIINISDNTEKFGAVFDFRGNDVVIKVSYSTVSCAEAKKNIDGTPSFDEVKKYAYETWNKRLGVIDISVKDEDFKRKFYSNLYHSIIKPCDMSREQVLGIEGDLVTDFATFWDQYKTVLPLVFMLYPEMGKKIAKAIVNISRSLRKIPCSLGLSDIFPCEEQAKMLGIFTLCDAYYFNSENISKEEIDECISRELKREDFSEFLTDGTFERYTHIIDTTDACLDVAQITDNKALKERLLKLSENWVKAYDLKSGLMSEKSEYYEGDKYTYSFRLQKNMSERIELCGGNERFVSLLDDFFGFNGESIKSITHTDAECDIAATAYHRFEGFNNECDMETPYAYIYAGRHDRACQIVHECITRSYTFGKGGLPGNNDSSGLSSCFIWNVLGLFPVSGSGELLIGSPHIDGAVIKLSNNNTLRIKVNNLSGDCYNVDKVSFNGKEITDYRISVAEIMHGGTLEFYLK